MPTYRHVIFDLDGTLVDSLPGIEWSIDVAFRECGLTAPPYDLKPLLGPPIRQILATILGIADGNGLDRLEGAFRRSYDQEGWRRTTCRQGAAELVWQLLCSGSELFVVTNKPAPATHKILRELKMAGFFREVACRGAESWKGAVLSGLMERRGLAPSDCLMVGDTEEDSRAAAAAGIACRIVSADYAEVVRI